MAGVDRHPLGDRGAGDEALVDACPVQVRPPDRAVAVGPVDVAGVDRDPAGDEGAGDEALVDAGPVQVRPSDRARDEPGLVDVAGVDGHAAEDVAAADEALARADGGTNVIAGDAAEANVAPKPTTTATTTVAIRPLRGTRPISVSRLPPIPD